MKPYLLFDAGGTLVFPDIHILKSVAESLGWNCSAHEFYQAHARVIFKLDVSLRSDAKESEPGKSFFQRLMEAVELPEEGAKEAARLLDDRNRDRSLWTFTFDWVRQTLEHLKEQGYSLSVISNADGRVEQQFLDLQMRHLFDKIFDSHLIGSSKPDPYIFEHALKALSLHPDEAIYIGDVFHIDVKGANRAGLRALHLDPFHFYRDWEGVRIDDISHLPGFLEQYEQHHNSRELFPFRA
ncbi:MAG: HAD family hydrolase [Candidatus Tectomicrobia bacterium]|nr:HAD family hydrolase [Candidatus Tectomicrobia bacterium]